MAEEQGKTIENTQNCTENRKEVENRKLVIDEHSGEREANPRETQSELQELFIETIIQTQQENIEQLESNIAQLVSSLSQIKKTQNKTEALIRLFAKKKINND